MYLEMVDRLKEASIFKAPAPDDPRLQATEDEFKRLVYSVAQEIPVGTEFKVVDDKTMLFGELLGGQVPYMARLVIVVGNKRFKVPHKGAGITYNTAKLLRALDPVYVLPEYRKAFKGFVAKYKDDLDGDMDLAKVWFAELTGEIGLRRDQGRLRWLERIEEASIFKAPAKDDPRRSARLINTFVYDCDGY